MREEKNKSFLWCQWHSIGEQREIDYLAFEMPNLINCRVAADCWEIILTSGSWENVNKSLIRNAFIFNQLR